jgi:hypothetical protein
LKLRINLTSARKREMREWPEDHAQTLNTSSFEVVVVRVEAEAKAVVGSTIEMVGAEVAEGVEAAAEDEVEQGGRI